MKKISFILAALMVLSLVLTACTTGAPAAPAAEAEKPAADAASVEPVQCAEEDAALIGFCDMASDSYAVMRQNLFTEYITALGFTPIVLAADSNVEKQLSQIEDMVTMGVKVLYIRPVDVNGIASGLEACEKAGIKIVGEDIPEGTTGVTCSVTSWNHYDLGVAQAVQMMALLDSNPDLTMNVGIIWGMRSLVPAQQRRNGFADTIQPYVESGRVAILDEQSIEGDVSKISGIVEDWRVAYPEMNCFVCPNDDLAMGAMNVLLTEGADLTGFYFYGMDGNDAALVSIKEGRMTCSVLADIPAAMKEISDICVQFANGEETAATIDLGLPAIYVDITNVDEYLQ